MLLLYVDCRTNDCLGLHNGNFRISNGKTQSSVSHHRVKLVQGSDNVLNLLNSLVLCLSELLDFLFLLRYELVERRIQETDGNGVTLKSLIKCLEVSLLEGKNLL